MSLQRVALAAAILGSLAVPAVAVRSVHETGGRETAAPAQPATVAFMLPPRSSPYPTREEADRYAAAVQRLHFERYPLPAPVRFVPPWGWNETPR